MLSIINNIPNLKKCPLHYVFEDYKLTHREGTLWLEFGVASGGTINYFSKFTEHEVYGFDSFQGLPEKWRDGFDEGAFDMDGIPPRVNENVVLIQGWFQDTLVDFLKQQNKKISFIHIDCDLYSSTKFILNTTLPYMDDKCVIVFDELVNYPGFDGETGELRAFYEWMTENNINYEWIGMNGTPIGMYGRQHENVAVIVYTSTEKT